MRRRGYDNMRKETQKNMRLDRFLSGQTAYSRKELTAMIRSGAVTVGGEVIRKPDTQIDPEQTTVTLRGRQIAYAAHHYYLLHKPAGVITASRDPKQKTVLDLLPPQYRRSGIFPAGRLDKDTTGLLILTDDGDYAHRMLSPKKHVDKTYIATLDREPDVDIAEAFAKGITLADGTVCQQGQAVCLGNHRAEVTIREGKYHQVKRMFAALGYKVVALERIRIGALSLDKMLKKGELRPLTEAETPLVFDRYVKKS